MRHSPVQSTSGTPSRFAGLAKLGCPTGVVGRGAAREAAICTAVIELLNELGYEAVTMDAVAGRAKASKATIYRRWSNKDDLVVDALRRVLVGRSDPVPDTGDLRTDLLAQINFRLGQPALFAANTAALKGLVYAASSQPELADLIRGALRDSQLPCIQLLLDRAHGRGQLRGPVDAGLIWEVAQGQFCSRTSVDTGVVDESYVEHIVDDILMPVIEHAGARAVVPR